MSQYNQDQQYQEWQRECAEVEAWNYEQISTTIEEKLAEPYDGSDPDTNESLATILMFEDYIKGKTNSF